MNNLEDNCDLMEVYGRRQTDTKSQIQVNALAAYIGLAGFAGAIVLWMANALIAQETKGLNESQIKMSVLVSKNEQSISKIENKIDSINNNINSRFDKFDARFQQLQEFLISQNK